MRFTCKPNYEKTLKRFEAVFQGEVADRVPVNIVLPTEKQIPVPQKQHASAKEFHWDIEFRAEQLDVQIQNTDYSVADAIPMARANLGPELISVWCGCELHYAYDTTWTTPCLIDWKDADEYTLDFENPVFKLYDRFMDLLIERGKGRFIVAPNSFAGSADNLAAMRNPQQFALDLYDHPEEVKRKLRTAAEDTFAAYDYFYKKIRAADMPLTAFITAIHEEKYHIIQNDFSYMVGEEMFEEFFLECVIRECRFFTKNFYHLDGIGALKHLDALLRIPELCAVQWMPGAGQFGFSRWIPVYQKIQKAKKGLTVHLDVGDLDTLFSSLRPEGIYIEYLGGIDSRETAKRVLERVRNWK